MVDNHQGSFATNPFITDFVDFKRKSFAQFIYRCDDIKCQKNKIYHVSTDIYNKKIYLIAIMAVEDTREA